VRAVKYPGWQAIPQSKQCAEEDSDGFACRAYINDT
jgi:hypothetical protein